MQKDLLAELQLPKLDLKNLENIVTQNSKRLACVIKENNEFIKKSKRIPPGFKVVMGGRILDIDVKFPLSTLENIKTVKRKFIIKKALNSGISLLKNDLGTSPSSVVTNSSSTTLNSIQDPITKDKDDEKKSDEIPALVTTKCHSNSTISPTPASLEPCQATSTETESLMGAVASSPRNEDTEVEILLDEESNKGSDLNPVSLNSHSSILETNIEIKEPVDKPSAEDAVVSSNSGDFENCGTTSSVEDSSGPMCVIAEVIGNAHAAFSEADDPQEKLDEAPETQIITPKKTNDITKIKGWRRKQFFVEKPTTVEFYSVSKGSRILKKKIELSDVFRDNEVNEEPGNKENAFVCDSLDEFLDQEADLKIGYEVPHLFAEYGIKLTSDEIVSRPSLSEKDLQEVGTRYCVPLSLPCDINLDDIKEEDIKRVKRPIEDDTKPCKLLKVDDSKRQPVKSMLKQGEKLKAGSPVSSPAPENLQKNECQLSRVHKDFNNIKLLSKLIALVVYPGPNRPLHPLVQYHLDKLRSYRTIVDKNWADFAASAVVVSESRCKRRIVPAYCCVKVERNLTKTNEQSVRIGQKKGSKKQLSKIKLKECSVVIKRLKPSEVTDPWCMEHSCYNCSRCGLTGFKIKTVSQSRLRMRSVLKVQRNIQREEEEKKELEEEHGETVTVSPRASFNRKIARLLAKKVRLLKANGDTLMSIDSLRVIKPDTIEFIKLKFIKESFLSGYINIWYLKPETSAVRSRAFLTFSQSSPVPNAINLKSTCLSLNNLPKVITEMVSAENTFDSNEYAILHCTDGIWEIHGSLNITFGKSDKYVEQIFTCLELPELKRLQEIAEKILHVKAVKWWVLDLTQKFKLIELKSGSFSTVVTRQKFLEVIKLNTFGFMPLRKDHENRILGAYVIQRLLPFVLIGPYYLLEARDIILKGVSSTVSFKYYGEENVTTNYPLKFFINSVIKNLEKKKNKKLEGLWLYDKMCLDKTIYIEVLTADLENHPPHKYSIIDIEHGYSLNSLTHPSSSGATSGIVKRKDGKDELQTVTVYLYFDIFDLGFLEGELQFDNSVIINHPLDERTKMKSHKIGDWIISIIRRKVGFIPKDLPIRWFITKHKEDLRERPPFNKFILGGAHVITKSGVFSLLELTESKIESLGLDKDEVLKIMSQCKVLKEVKQLKNLAKLLKSDPTKRVSMEEILKKAVNEIKALEKLQMDLESKKALVETRKLNLASDFLKLVNSFNVRCHYKIKMIEIIEKLFRKENGKLNECFVKRLKRTRIGWNYIKHLERQRKNLSAESSKSAEIEHLIRFLQKLSENNSNSRKPAPKALNASSDTVETTSNYPTDSQPQVTKLRLSSKEVSPFVVSQAEIVRTPSPLKEPQVQNVESKQKKNSEIVIQKPESISTAKPEGFIKLNSTQLPDNIKMCWKKWNVNKLEVA